MRNNFAFFFVFTIFIHLLTLNAEDFNLLTEYRKTGIETIAQKLDKQLAQKSYWKHFLQDKDTRFGYLESYSNILVCDKSRSFLELFRYQNTHYQLQREYNAFTGKEKGDKEHEGDLKTPVGIYNLVKKLENVDSFYGPLAFVTSYPNLYDRYKHKTGRGIWIHGLPTDQTRDEFTKGCIAIDNKSIECLNKNIDINKTILLIYENEEKIEISKETLSQLLAQLYQWRYAWVYNNLERYLSFYSEDFIRFDGMNKKKFSQYKQRIFARNEAKTILFNDINIIPYPNEEGTFKITFHEFYKSRSFTFRGDKILIVHFKNNTMKIITEQ